jgi:two-component system sensor histidine kinase/response regulator
MKKKDAKKIILVVDDEPNNVLILDVILGDHYEIVSATTGEEALKKIEDHRIDLVLLDVVMPGMDGFAVCKKIKNTKKTRETVVIFVTSKDDPDAESYGLTLGANDYLNKPVSASIVKARVQNHLAMADNNKIMKKQNEKLKLLNEEKNKMIGMAAHDLRSPIASIIGLSECIEPMLTDPDSKDFLKLIMSESEKLLHLLNSLLDLSSLESLTFSIDKKTASLATLIKNQLKLLSYLALKKDIKIVEIISTDILVEIDSQRFEQVFSNLVTNALKYGPKGKPVTVECGQNENEFWVSVRDQGEGISTQNQKKLFLPFQKLGSKPTGGEKSTGLGLAICKKIIDAHQGRIDVFSSPGKGSDFRIYCPLR